MKKLFFLILVGLSLQVHMLKAQLKTENIILITIDEEANGSKLTESEVMMNKLIYRK